MIQAIVTAATAVIDKMFALRTVIFSFLILTSSSIAHADWPDYWKGDRRFPLVWGFRMHSFYLDRTSIFVKLNNSPKYIIAANVLVVENNTDYSYQSDNIKSTMTFTIYFDEEKTEMYMQNDGAWEYLSPLVLVPRKKSLAMNTGEALYYIFTNRKFYGKCKWKDKDHPDYTDAYFTEGLYSRL